MTQDPRSASVDLDMIATGEVSPADSRRIVREALLAQGVDHSARVYAALRNLAWRLLTAREYSDQLSGWYDVVRTASSTCRKTERISTADRLSVLAELISQSARFSELQSPEDVLERKHVRALLSILRDAGGSALRTSLAAGLGLADANLSRILTVLRSNGFVTREMDGKEASFRLTEAGWSAVGGFPEAQIPVPLKSLPIPVAVWDRSRSVFSGNEAFAELTTRHGLEVLRELPAQRWMDALGAAATDRLPTRRADTQDFFLSGGFALRCTVSRVDDVDMMVLLDVSEQRQVADALRSRIDGLQTEVVDLKSLLGNERERFHWLGNSMRNVREAVLASSATAWKTAYDHIGDGLPGSSFLVPKALLISQAAAINHTVGNLLFSPFSDSSVDEPDVALDIRKSITDSLEAYRAVQGREIDAEFGAIMPVMTSGAFAPALTKLIYVCSKYYDQRDVLRLKASVVKECLVVTMKATHSARHREVGSPTVIYRSEEGIATSDPGMRSFGVLAHELGMDFEVDDADQTVRLAVPVKVPPKVGRKTRPRASAP